MYNLHCHSLLSDGTLLPSEVVMRYKALGYKTIAITDHVDYSNSENVIDSILKFSCQWPKDSDIKVLAGVELTHLPLEQFKPLAKYARDKGIAVIVAHGQTPAEPVIEGTNHAALEADIDILAHPGLISGADIKLAKEKGIFLEITSRASHASTNSYVAEHSLKLGAKLILNTDSHSPEDIIDYNELANVAKESGINLENLENIFKNVKEFIRIKTSY